MSKILYPFFILGNPRSGTSLFRLMLNSHPHIIVPPESGFLQWWFDKYQNLSLQDIENYKFVKELVRDILSSKKIESWNINFDEIIKEINTEKPKNYGDFCILVYKVYGKRNGKKKFLIGDKNNYYINHLETLNIIYPNAKYIHLIRDGRDVACSYKNIHNIKSDSIYKPKLPREIDEIAREWKNNIQRIEDFILTKEHIRISYEDLVTNTEKTLILVTDFLEIKYSRNMLEYYLDKNYDEPTSTVDWKSKTKQKVDAGNTGKYKKIFSPKQIIIFTKIAGKVLIKYGYKI